MVKIVIKIMKKKEEKKVSHQHILQVTKKK